jgi:hypothetical protein
MVPGKHFLLPANQHQPGLRDLLLHPFIERLALLVGIYHRLGHGTFQAVTATVSQAFFSRDRQANGRIQTVCQIALP